MIEFEYGSKWLQNGALYGFEHGVLCPSPIMIRISGAKRLQVDSGPSRRGFASEFLPRSSQQKVVSNTMILIVGSAGTDSWKPGILHPNV